MTWYNENASQDVDQAPLNLTDPERFLDGQSWKLLETLRFPLHKHERQTWMELGLNKRSQSLISKRLLFPFISFLLPSFPSSLPFPSFPFLSLPFPSFPFLSLLFFLSLAPTPAHHSSNQLDLPRRYTSLKRASLVDCMFWLIHLIKAVTSSIIEGGLQKLNWHSYTVQWAVTMPEEPNKENSKPAKKIEDLPKRNGLGPESSPSESEDNLYFFPSNALWLSPGR